MAISLKDLQEAMAPLAKVGKGELDFMVLDQHISLRALSPDEEIEVQRFARAVLVEGDLTDQIAGLEYLDRFRRKSLAYSLVQIGKLDFRDVEYVETGDKLPGGQAIKVKRDEAIYNLVGTWSKGMIVGVFAKFGELMNQVEAETEGLIEVDPVDYDAEIARLEERIRGLKEDKARQEASLTDLRSKVRNEVASTKGASFRKALPVERPATDDEQVRTGEEPDSIAIPSDVEREIVEEISEEPVEETVETPSGPRTPIFARAKGPVAPPPMEEPTSEESESTPPEASEASELDSSMVDMNDPDATQKAIEAENERLLRMRQGRRPQHLGARTVAQELTKSAGPEVPAKAPSEGSGPKGVLPTEQPKLVGEKDGVPVYRMPTQSLSDRGRGDPPKSAVIPSSGPSRNANPRFRTPTKK